MHTLTGNDAATLTLNDRQHLTVTAEAAEVHFAADLAEGRVPSARRVKAELHVGQDRAAQIRDHLAAVAAAPGGAGPRELSGSTS